MKLLFLSFVGLSMAGSSSLELNVRATCAGRGDQGKIQFWKLQQLRFFEIWIILTNIDQFRVKSDISVKFGYFGQSLKFRAISDEFGNFLLISTFFDKWAKFGLFSPISDNFRRVREISAGLQISLKIKLRSEAKRSEANNFSKLRKNAKNCEIAKIFFKF